MKKCKKIKTRKIMKINEVINQSLPELFSRNASNLEFLKMIKNYAIRSQMYELGAYVRDIERTVEEKNTENFNKICLHEVCNTVFKNNEFSMDQIENMTVAQLREAYNKCK